jgi:hypothetical protein
MKINRAPRLYSIEDLNNYIAYAIKSECGFMIPILVIKHVHDNFPAVAVKNSLADDPLMVKYLQGFDASITEILSTSGALRDAIERILIVANTPDDDLISRLRSSSLGTAILYQVDRVFSFRGVMSNQGIMTELLAEFKEIDSKLKLY